ncbi:hypothetical protein MMC32_001987 [Xylographa parallela]|nr:hypothetical protein [Xylographa parallela]
MSTNPSNNPLEDRWWYCTKCRITVDGHNWAINGTCPGCIAPRPTAAVPPDYHPLGYRIADDSTTLFAGAHLQNHPDHPIGLPPSSHASSPTAGRPLLIGAIPDASTLDAFVILPGVPGLSSTPPNPSTQVAAPAAAMVAPNPQATALAVPPATPAAARAWFGMTAQNPFGRA